MKRLREWQFNFAVGLSLLLCIVLLADWIIQQRYYHWFGISTWSMQGPHRYVRYVGITARHGEVALSYSTMVEDPTKAMVQRDSRFDYGIAAEPNWRGMPDGPLLNHLGFMYITDVNNGNELYGGLSQTYTGLWLPTWFLVAVFAVLPLLALKRWRRRRLVSQRIARGLCPACGYDLRASPEKCPECGALPESVQGAAV